MTFQIIRSNKKVEFAKQLIKELDDLYFDLEVVGDCKEEEITIKSKIKLRENMLVQLGSL